MNNIIQNVLLTTVVGDALATPLEGMSKGHINTHFGELNGYVDTEPALKGKMERWKKPGLYSSITQFMIILGLTASRREGWLDAFRQCVADSPQLQNHPSGIFRNPDGVEKKFITRKKESKRPTEVATPAVRIIPALAPLSHRKNEPIDHIADIAAFVRLFTSDPGTCAAALLYSFLLKAFINEKAAPASPLRKSLELTVKLIETVEFNAGVIFDMGVNPGALGQELRNLSRILSAIVSIDTVENGEKLICAGVNAGLKTPITRASVNIPVALVPYAILTSTIRQDDPSLLFLAAAEGGMAATLTALTGAMSAARYGPALLPDKLVHDLVNRKKVVSLLTSIAAGTVTAGLLDDFIRSEASLTAKEQDELKAHLKHGKKKPKKGLLSRADKAMKLSRHVVESWTKRDKAKWKKEQKQKDKRK
ncbi:MAG: ADP-ribosylglycohydrolase family protein [Spirochaetes bacterium]|nr:ADP-ribosylglycohydrolase family protein [Spirochaetota bacterium]